VNVPADALVADTGYPSARSCVLATALAVVSVVSTPSTALYAFAAYALTLLALLLTARVPWPVPTKRMALVAGFVLLMTCLTPFTAHHGTEPVAQFAGWPVYAPGLWIMWNATAKAVLSVGFMSLLVATTPPLHILQALDELHLPRLVVALTGFICRYLHVLREEALRIRRACISRGYQGRWLWQARTIGAMIAVLFLRSYERAERVHGAMCARGYVGHWPRHCVARVTLIDVVFLSVAILWLAFVRMGLT
jgi:cobalt/nickel transport system permease protein